MADKCPGQWGQVIKVGLYRCPSCKYHVEIFSDELKAKCPKCGKIIYKEKVPSCVDWCASAKKCIGEARWEEIEKQRKKGVKNGKKTKDK